MICKNCAIVVGNAHLLAPFEMSISISIAGGEREIGRRSYRFSEEHPPMMSDLFNGTPQLYRGSSFVVEELLDLDFAISNQQLVQTYFDYFTPRKKIGNYLVAPRGSNLDRLSEVDSGLISSENIQIRRYRNFTIQGHPDAPVGAGERIHLDDCNILLQATGAVVPPLSVPSYKLATHTNVLVGQQFWERASLENAEFQPSISTFGFFLFPGVYFVGATYSASVINTINVVPNPAIEAVCEIPSTCDEQFAAFLATSNFFAATAEELVVRFGCTPVIRQFVSPIDPACQRDYYFCESA